MTEKKIFEIYTEFLDLIKDLRHLLHPEYQAELDELPDVFLVIRGLEIAESSAEFRESGTSSVELKQDTFILFQKIADYIDTKKLMDSDKLAALWEVVDNLELSIKHSSAIAEPTVQENFPEHQATKGRSQASRQ